MTEHPDTADIADAIAAALEPHGITGLVMPDIHNPGIFRLRRHIGGTVVIGPEGPGWSYSVYGRDDAEPITVDGTEFDIDTIAADVAGWVAGTGPHPSEPVTDTAIRAALERILDGNPPGRPIDDVMDDYQDRFGLVMPDLVDPGAVWAVLLVEPGGDPETVPLYNLDGAVNVWMCSCGATLSDGTDEKGRMSCETCGKYYTDRGIALAHPEDMGG